jgi:hypothetical protein
MPSPHGVRIVMSLRRLESGLCGRPSRCRIGEWVRGARPLKFQFVCAILENGVFDRVVCGLGILPPL